jgi:hypothetical protein
LCVLVHEISGVNRGVLLSSFLNVLFLNIGLKFDSAKFDGMKFDMYMQCDMYINDVRQAGTCVKSSECPLCKSYKDVLHGTKVYFKDLIGGFHIPSLDRVTKIHYVQIVLLKQLQCSYSLSTTNNTTSANFSFR